MWQRSGTRSAAGCFEPRGRRPHMHPGRLRNRWHGAGGSFRESVPGRVAWVEQGRAAWHPRTRRSSPTPSSSPSPSGRTAMGLLAGPPRNTRSRHGRSRASSRWQWRGRTSSPCRVRSCCDRAARNRPSRPRRCRTDRTPSHSWGRSPHRRAPRRAAPVRAPGTRTPTSADGRRSRRRGASAALRGGRLLRSACPQSA
jgi:hypothetical protein